jgi:hypothetical protein
VEEYEVVLSVYEWWKKSSTPKASPLPAAASQLVFLNDA